jgi:hypothetical protein
MGYGPACFLEQGRDAAAWLRLVICLPESHSQMKLGRPMPNVVQANAVLFSPDETGSAKYRLTPAGPLFRRYATRSLEESRGLVPPYANGCDEVLSIVKLACVFGDPGIAAGAIFVSC